ncbi:MAG: asparagine synthase-related protein [Candidatus Rokuibacteriota bacterium]
MNVLAGVLYRDPGRRPAADLPLAMVARVPGAGEPVGITSGPLGLFVAGGPEHLKSEDSMILVADLDLVDLSELRPLTGLVGPAGILARLRGAFAFALWDRRERRLLLAVDQFGIKRLYYVTTAAGFAFASRPEALLAFSGTKREIDPAAVYHYLNFGFVPAPHSIYAGVRRLPPGHALVVSGGDPTVKPYWNLTYPERPSGLREGATTTFQMAKEAVALSLRGTTPKETGSFLSGGTDSSTIVGLMGEVTGERVNAFSIGFREPRYDELRYAELAARHFNAAHYTETVTPDEALAALPRLVEAFDEPFGNNSALGTFFCARLARQCGIKHLLAGDGGDEIFGGNERYRTDRIFGLYHRIPRLIRRGLLEPILLHGPDGRAGLVGRVQRYIRRANLPNPGRFYSYEFFFAQKAEEFLTPEFIQAVDPGTSLTLIQHYFDRVQATSELNRLLYLDLKLSIGDNDLLKVTRTAELAGIGVRFPLLDLPLVEFTATWPAGFKVRGLEKRYLFKRAFRTLLPPETLAKPKHGFGVPTSDWLKTHPGFQALARETLLSPRARQRGYFRAGAIEELFERHVTDTTPFYGDILWSLLMLELWHQHHLNGRTA